MSWATIDAEGYLQSSYAREVFATLNARGLDVVECSEEVARDSVWWRYDRNQSAWVQLEQPRTIPGREPPTDYAARRRLAYGEKLDADLQFEAIVEALLALATPAARAASPTSFDRLDAIAAKIAAVKAAHPKP